MSDTDFGAEKVASQPARCSIVLMVLPSRILVFVGRTLANKLLAGRRMLALAKPRKVLGGDRSGKAKLAKQAGLAIRRR